MKKLLNGVFFTAVAINPQDDASGVSRTATAHLQPVISVLRQFDGEVDDESKENTTWVSTASGVHDNACLSKGIVVRLGRLELPRPKALEPKSSASANSATGARRESVTVTYSPRKHGLPISHLQAQRTFTAHLDCTHFNGFAADFLMSHRLPIQRAR